jgi:vancomycin resistance protein VanJ
MIRASRGAVQKPLSKSSLLLSPWGPLLLLMLIAAGKQFIGERWWLTTWLVYLPQALFLAPSMVLLSLCLLLRRWRQAGGHVLSAIVGVGLLFSGVYRWPDSGGRGAFRVMTWNVMGLDGDPDGVLAAIRRERPDVLMIQEANRAHGPEPVTWLLARLPGWHSVRGGDVAILAPYSLTAPRQFTLGPRDTSRVALLTSLRADGRELSVLTVHFNTGLPRQPFERAWNHPRRNMAEAAAVRKEQADHLVDIVAHTGHPLILGGDFNSPPDAYACQVLSPPLRSAFTTAGAGFGWTFPSSHPVLRIDHLFVSGEFEVQRSRVLPELASDHRPLVADLSWQRN